MVDKDFCLSSFIAYRYIYKDDVDFFPNLHHHNFELPPESSLTHVTTAKDIHESLKEQINHLYEQYQTIGVLLSGGMDSAIVTSYLRQGSYAYTFTNKETSIYDSDISRAQYYCKKKGLKHRFVEINFEDYKTILPTVMKAKQAPVHSIEPQIYKAATMALQDGVDVMLIGDGSDYIFGGMDKLLLSDWQKEKFIKRYTLLEPSLVLTNPREVTDLFTPYITNENTIDVPKFLSQGPAAVESYGSYHNAFEAAELPYCDPYTELIMAEPLDLKRIKNGEPKYLIRELFTQRYPDIPIPDKIPMPRPVDIIFKDWAGPTRPEFRTDIPLAQLTGNQKWQLWCAEQFLNQFEK